jgi:phosphohistidine phosphatase SixA
MLFRPDQGHPGGSTMRLLLLALILALGGCTTVTADAAQAPVYYVMRHLNTPQGERDPDLTAEGQAAAARLPGLFTRERPAAIYVSNFRRTQQTAAPLAARLGLTPIVYDPADTPALVGRVRSGPLPALVAGHSNTVPDIVEQLGGTRPGPLSHPDFGDVWRVDAQGRTERLRVP